MTDQLQQAMTDYPDELRVVMEKAGWKYHEPILAWRDESVEWTRTATDNDAIVAAMCYVCNQEWPNQRNWMVSPRLCDWLQWIRDNQQEMSNANDD